MASSNDDDVPIKYESPYPADSMPQSSPQSPALKRRLSEEPDEMGEKRQRVDSGPANLAMPDDDMAAILAQATAAATQGIEEAAEQAQEEAEDEPGLFIDQDETKEEQPALFLSDPHLSMRILSLPVLESLSTQILSTLAQGPYSETIRIVTAPESDFGQAYATLKMLFDETKKIYSRQAPFLSADDLNIQEPEHRATIRTTNLATFVSSVFGGQDVGFYELNDHFIETFTPDGEPLKKVPGELFLNLKTQMYLSAVSQEEQERNKEDILEDLFPFNLEDTLAGRHLETPLSQNEISFLEASKARREYLMNQPSDVDSIQALSEKFAWEDFLRSLSSYLSQAYEPLIAPYMKRHALTAPASPVHTSSRNGNHSQQNGRDYNSNGSGTLDINALAELAAQEALQAYGQNQYQQQSQQNGGPQQTYLPQGQNAPYHSQHSNDGSVPFPTQTQPTRVLYERARQAAVAKTNPGNARRPGLPSQRRPWSTEEENALMAGLDAVKGPHWSQILALYGTKGSINEILKDRNQVQLKDKARNLKLFFLKSGIEVPYFLQSVTGELKTRAPSQAARKEAEERARLGSEDERARFDGIMALSQGLRPPPFPQAQTPRAAQEHPQHTLNSPEHFQVVEPEKEEPLMQPTPSPPQEISEDEQFRQRLIAATKAEGRAGETAADGAS